jgi:hypothetical protein
MSREYHCLVAGLPELFFNDTKPILNLNDFRKMLGEFLHPDDMEIIKLYFYRYDNLNLLSRLNNNDILLNPLGNLSEQDIDELLARVKDDSFLSDAGGTALYLGQFAESFRDETPIVQGKSWELQLSELYFSHATSHPNKFISSWFRFERDLLNIVTASQCRKYSIKPDNQLNGSGELTDKLGRSNARDFGIDNDFPFLDQILKAVEEEDMKEFEKKIDLIKWEYLDNEVFFYYFTIEKIFSFLVKLSIAERWLVLDRKTGLELFRKLVSSMETSYAFTDEFKLKK